MLNMTDLFVRQIEIPDALLLLRLNLNILEIILDQAQVVSVWSANTRRLSGSPYTATGPTSPAGFSSLFRSSSLSPTGNYSLTGNQSLTSNYSLTNGSAFEEHHLGYFLVQIFTRLFERQKSVQMRPSIISRYYYIVRKYYRRCIEEKCRVPVSGTSELHTSMFDFVAYFSKNAHLVPLQAELPAMCQAILLYFEFFIVEGAKIMFNSTKNEADTEGESTLFQLLAHLAVHPEAVRFIIQSCKQI